PGPPEPHIFVYGKFLSREGRDARADLEELVLNQFEKALKKDVDGVFNKHSHLLCDIYGKRNDLEEGGINNKISEFFDCVFDALDNTDSYTFYIEVYNVKRELSFDNVSIILMPEDVLNKLNQAAKKSANDPSQKAYCCKIEINDCHYHYAEKAAYENFDQFLWVLSLASKGIWSRDGLPTYDRDSQFTKKNAIVLIRSIGNLKRSTHYLGQFKLDENSNKYLAEHFPKLDEFVLKCLANEYYLAMSSRVPAIAIRHFMSCLEFLFHEGQNDATKHVTKRPAKLLADDTEQEKRYIKDLNNLYELRSISIHSGLHKKKKKVTKEDVIKAQRYLRRSLDKMFQKGLYSCEDVVRALKEEPEIDVNPELIKALKQRKTVYFWLDCDVPCIINALPLNIVRQDSEHSLFYVNAETGKKLLIDLKQVKYVKLGKDYHEDPVIAEGELQGLLKGGTGVVVEY
ncbi:MAG: hypothetical protein HRT88_13120, partial [Lentisphaeraceae bacterium]|nr:hypothetical protein [Lentisphaeraceae bacterium]